MEHTTNLQLFAHRHASMNHTEGCVSDSWGPEATGDWGLLQWFKILLSYIQGLPKFPWKTPGYLPSVPNGKCTRNGNSGT